MRTRWRWAVHRPDDPAAYARKVLVNRRRSLLRRAGPWPSGASWPSSSPWPWPPASPACSPAGRPAVRLGDLAGLERGRHLCHRLALPLHPGAGLPEGRPLAVPDRPGRDRRGPRRPPAGPGGGPAARRRPAHHQCPARRGAWRAYVRQASEDVFELEFPGYGPRPGTGVHAEDIEPTYLLKGQLGVLRDCLS